MFIVGYHGTNKQRTLLIDKQGFSDSNEDSWLGAGVYFFGDLSPSFSGLTEAKWWVTDVKKFDYWVIYKAGIESDNVFDLVEDQISKSQYKKLWKILLKKHIDAGIDPKDFSCHDVIVQARKKVEVIRCFVDAMKPVGEFNSYIIGHPQIQICVYKNSENVIKNYKIVEKN